MSWPMLSARLGDGLARLPEQLDAAGPRIASKLPTPSRSNQLLRPGRQRLLHVAEHGRGIDLAALHLLHEAGALADQRAEDQRHRDDGDDDADEHAQGRRAVAARPEPALEGALQRLEDDGEDHRPEDRAVEGQQQPEEGDRDQREQEQEGLVFELGLHRRRAPGARCVRLGVRLSAQAAGWQGIDHAAGLQPKPLSFSMKRIVPALAWAWIALVISICADSPSLRLTSVRPASSST